MMLNRAGRRPGDRLDPMPASGAEYP